MKVGLVIPTGGSQVHVDFAKSLLELVTHSDDHFVFINPRSSLVPVARNRGVTEALNNEVDYLLFLDSDMSFPAETAVRLMAAGKDIIGCNYLQRNPPHRSLAFPRGGGKKTHSGGVVEVDRIPTGVMLVRRKVFETLPRPWFFTPVRENGGILGEDYYFCDKAREAGFSVWMDCELSTQVVHWGEMGFRWNGTGCDLTERENDG